MHAITVQLRAMGRLALQQLVPGLSMVYGLIQCLELSSMRAQCPLQFIAFQVIGERTPASDLGLFDSTQNLSTDCPTGWSTADDTARRHDDVSGLEKRRGETPEITRSGQNELYCSRCSLSLRQGCSCFVCRSPSGPQGKRMMLEAAQVVKAEASLQLVGNPA